MELSELNFVTKIVEGVWLRVSIPKRGNLYRDTRHLNKVDLNVGIFVVLACKHVRASATFGGCCRLEESGVRERETQSPFIHPSVARLQNRARLCLPSDGG